LILLKLVVEVGTRRLLGVQAVGPGRADKRIDVAATLIAGHMTLEQIANMDLSYAPPYSTDMDNLITAANVARNKLSGQMVGRKPAEVHQMIRDRAEFVLLDVRTPEEADQSRLQGSVVLPLGSLRSRMDELPRDQEIITYCDISLRAYEAARMLMTSGFNRVSVLEGGLAMWPYEKTE
jgi:rhodanese-related sulfurtransferase